MKPNLIKAEITKANTTQAAIAAYLDVSAMSVSRVINGTMRSERIEAELTKIIGKNIFKPKSKAGRKRSVWTGKVPA
jgi:predicted XRE-type DNA-binding protein